MWGWAVTTDKVLKWFNDPRARAHPRCEVSCQGVLHRRFIRASSRPVWQWRKLQSWPTCSLVAMFPQCSVITCSTQISCCRERTLRMRSQSGVCEPLMPDVVVSKAHSDNHSYVSSVDLPSDSLCKNLAWWAVTLRISKPQNCQIGGWPLARDNMVSNMYSTNTVSK